MYEITYIGSRTEQSTVVSTLSLILTISFMYAMNNNEPKTLPLGTPEVIGKKVDL